MGIVSSLFHVPPSPKEYDEYKKFLKERVTALEFFVNTIKKKPSYSQQQYYASEEQEFKHVYKMLVEHKSTDSELDAIMTRFGRMQQTWNRLVRPESYEPLKEPLLDP